MTPTRADGTGYTATALGSLGLLPQIFKNLRTRSTEDLNLTMYIVYCVGVLFWLAYGVLRHSGPMIAANSITITFALVTLIQKVKYTR